MDRLRMAVIGVGHLGQNHARILAGLPGVELVGVADVDPGQARAVAERTGCAAFADYRELLGLVDAATVVVPTTQHHQVALDFLARGVPLLIEKPLAATLREAESLVQAAARAGVPLQVGHIERFNPAFEELKRRPMQPKFVQCQRVGPFTGRSADIGVVLDLMIHDLDLLLNFVAAPVRSLEAVGVSVFGRHEDIANARLHFANGCTAEVTASRASPAPSRRMSVWSPEGYAEVDFQARGLTLMQPSPEVRRHGLDPQKLDPLSRSRLKDELFGRHVQTLRLDCGVARADQLTRELEDFVRCVRTGEEPRVTGSDGLKAIALADRILDRIRAHRWENRADGPVGPSRLPEPLGPLFQPHAGEAAA